MTPADPGASAPDPDARRVERHVRRQWWRRWGGWTVVVAVYVVAALLVALTTGYWWLLLGAPPMVIGYALLLRGDPRPYPPRGYRHGGGR